MKYLKPLNFYKEIFKDILMKKDSKHGRLLGLDVSDKYVSLAVSDWKNLTAVPLRALCRQENNLSSTVADIFQSLIPEHNIVGFVVGTKYDNPIDAQTQNFIDDLCKTEKVEGLKYTFWDRGIRSKETQLVVVNSSSSSSVSLKGHKGHRQFLYGECSSKNQRHVTSSCGGSSDKERQSMDVIKDGGSITYKSEGTKIGCLEKRGSKCNNDVGKKCISESLGCSKSIKVFGSQDGSSGVVAVSGDRVVFINFDKDKGFEEGKIACCGTGELNGEDCSGGPNRVKFNLCEDPGEYVFFDSAHHSQMTNLQLAQLLWNGTGAVTGPHYNVKELFELNLTPNLITTSAI
ncbi:hypothetical protein LWI29_021668 [Acer saccharum]|uniref:YqgF/RNase H-like domain-containing protein n=1 Tax=Acer saccharum TaxID=4024 RepID=A0AA39SPC6_ACESA|nr:hypothetical protein LWI29_021668 [Acer saccharum]